MPMPRLRTSSLFRASSRPAETTPSGTAVMPIHCQQATRSGRRLLKKQSSVCGASATRSLSESATAGYKLTPPAKIRFDREVRVIWIARLYVSACVKPTRNCFQQIASITICTGMQFDPQFSADEDEPNHNWRSKRRGGHGRGESISVALFKHFNRNMIFFRLNAHSLSFFFFFLSCSRCAILF